MKMKRWLSCTLALAMLLGLMGCGGTSDEAPNDGSGSSEDEIVINYPTFQRQPVRETYHPEAECDA